jgi:hypothetical protein
MLEGCIEVMGLGVSLVDCISDDLLNSLRSEPGFTVKQSWQVGMGSEKWVKYSCLVFLDEVIICWISNETWKISTGENHT